MKYTFYFSHDYNARNDVKIKKLIQKQGICGYGVFWAIIEDLYNNANALPLDYESIAYELRIDIHIIKSVINDFGLFVIEGNEFGSKSVQTRLEERNERSTKARESAFKRWNNNKDDANTLQPHSEGNAIKEKKGNESKEKKVNEINNIFSFSDFWNVYPTKVSRSKCELKYYKLSLSEIQQIKDTIKSFVNHKPFENYNHPHPETYINQKRWQDVIPKNTTFVPVEKSEGVRFLTRTLEHGTY